MIYSKLIDNLSILIFIQMEQIIIARPEHSSSIVDFQLAMAMQTENFVLDKELVSKAVSYFISLNQENKSNPLGFYLVKLIDSVVVASLMLTIQEEKKWWIQSVYVHPQYRRKGHFTSLFERSVQIATQRQVKSIKLYAESDNQRAKQAYFKLGMKVINGRFYSYDFVYGSINLKPTSNLFTFRKADKLSQQASKWLQGKKNYLSNSSLGQNPTNLVIVQKKGKLVGVSKYFHEFSDWRFGVIRYIRQIYFQQENFKQLIQEMINFLVKDTFKIAAIRFIIDESIAHLFEGGHLEHYDILQIQI